MSNAKDLHNPIAHWISRLKKRRSPLEKDWALKSNYLLSNSCGKTQLSTQHSFPPFSNFIFWIRGLYSRKLLFVLSFLSYSRRASCYCSVTAPTALRPSGTTQNFKRKRKEKKQEKKQSSSFYLLAFPGRFFLGEKPVTVSMAFRAAETQRLCHEVYGRVVPATLTPTLLHSDFGVFTDGVDRDMAITVTIWIVLWVVYLCVWLLW